MTITSTTVGKNPKKNGVGLIANKESEMQQLALEDKMMQGKG